MATKNALFPIFEYENFTNTHFRKVTKFQFNCFSRLGAAFKRSEGGWHPPPPQSDQGKSDEHVKIKVFFLYILMGYPVNAQYGQATYHPEKVRLEI